MAATLALMDPWIIWFLAGLGLIVSEFLLPGVILVFFGLAAWIVAGLTFIGLISSAPLQLIVFAAASLVLTGSFRRVLMRSLHRDQASLPSGSDHEDEFTGKPVTVLTAFPSPGATGKVEFKGAEWNARSEDELAPGDPAEIVSLDGITLNIRRQWLPPFP